MNGQVQPPGSNPSVPNPFGQPTFQQQMAAGAQAAPTQNLHTVTVEGQQVQVSYQELLNGYAAHQKVTQVSQELAEAQRSVGEYKRFFDSMQADPQSIIDQIRTKYPDRTTGTLRDNSDDGIDDPMSAEVDQLKAELAQLRTQQASSVQQQRLDLEVNRLERVYGDQFDRTQILAFATAKGMDNLEDAYKLWQFENGQAPGDPGAPPAQPVSPGNPADLERAQRAQQALSGVAPGSTPQPGAEPPQQPHIATTPAEAFQQAIVEHGGDPDVILS